MNRWTAIVPIKPPDARKSRLAGSLSADERLRLSEAMLRHVLSVLTRSRTVGEVVVLARTPPPGWRGGWAEDCGGELNAELQRAAARFEGRVMVIHADLPNLSDEDIAELADTPDHQVTLAPDRHLTGTNAIALGRACTFTFAFGPGSFARHRRAAGEAARVIVRPGLSLDIDEPEDLRLLPCGFLPPGVEPAGLRQGLQADGRG